MKDSFYAALFYHHPTPALVTDERDMIVDANRSACKLVGKPIVQLLNNELQSTLRLGSTEDGHEDALNELKKHNSFDSRFQAKVLTAEVFTAIGPLSVQTTSTVKFKHRNREYLALFLDPC